MSVCVYFEGSFSTVFEEKGEKTFTDVVVNSFVGHGHPLFVLAAHTNQFKHTKGIDNGTSLVPLERIQDTSKIPSDEIIDIYDVAGKFRLSKRQKGSKLPVVHLNKTQDRIDSLYVNRQMVVGRASDDKWSVASSSSESMYWKSRRYSICNNFVSTMLVGFFKFGDVLTRTYSSYSVLKETDVGADVPFKEFFTLILEDVGLKPGENLLVRPSLVTVDHVVTMRGLVPTCISVIRNEGSISMKIEEFGLSDDIGRCLE